jgi:hypothetical protein
MSKRNNASLVEPVATKCSFNYQAQPNRVSTSQSLKSHFITIQNVPVSPVIKKTRLLPSVLRLPSKTQNRLLPSTVVRAKPKKSRVASLGLETLFNGQPFQFNSRVSRAEKSLEGVLHKCQLGCRRQATRLVFRKQKFSCQSTSSWCGCNLVLRVVCA